MTIDKSHKSLECSKKKNNSSQIVMSQKYFIFHSEDMFTTSDSISLSRLM